MKNIKKLAMLLLFSMFLSLAAPMIAAADENVPKILIDGSEYILSAEPYTTETGLMVGAEDIAKALDLDYTFDLATKSFTVNHKAYDVVFMHNAKHFFIDGTAYNAGTVFYLKNDVPMIEIGTICKVFGAYYTYDSNSKQILLQKGKISGKAESLGFEKTNALTGTIKLGKKVSAPTGDWDVELFILPCYVADGIYDWSFKVGGKYPVDTVEFTAGEKEAEFFINLDDISKHIGNNNYMLFYSLNGYPCGTSNGYYTQKKATVAIDTIPSDRSYTVSDWRGSINIYDEEYAERLELYFTAQQFDKVESSKITLTIDQSIPNDEHVLTNWEVLSNAGLSCEGMRSCSCINCDYTITEMIPTRAFSATRAYQNNFSDVAENAWYHSYIKTAYEYSLTNGVSQTKYTPDGNFTVAQALTAAANIHSAYHNNTIETAGAAIWYAPYVGYCIENSIVTIGQFNNYDRNITRGEMAMIFANTLPRMEYAMNRTGRIPDVSSDMACYDAVYQLFYAGIVGGDANTGNFRPNDFIKRSEACVIFTRLAAPTYRIGGAPTYKIPSTVNIGDTVMFGEYEQDDNYANGLEAIEWIVLDKKDGKALLLSKYTLDYVGFSGSASTPDGHVYWSLSHLRNWLNGSFYQHAFTSAEQQSIVTSTLNTYKCKHYGTGIDEITEDKVFALSKEEADLYSYVLKAETTAYAAEKSKSVYRADNSGDYPIYFSDHHLTSWWLRTSGGTRDRAMLVRSNGTIDQSGPAESGYAALVRPAMWVYLDQQ
ncbi:MAG: S-layer homology domain-containing protein [Clostridia bacterium]|nr:S-layer homology domain-containing protein [Clostridia bacterium]